MEVEHWNAILNQHGLFDNHDDAAHFLTRYLECDDPDRGWVEDGWTDDPEYYAVVKISRLRVS
ncbi:hypothetical protein DB30_02993 [Enhygromyxa salina]|uniref:Uncharacterized protein n=1 Tax=Enhygromyxa salina TaxID=215803 RepID=A0A0C2A2Y0_9BACT|nr:hypothetical protein [Enhygromyxa salina]KIG17718.1 hypothetical protein DB30_02993 [Enhygromyxa salina]